MSLSDAQYVQLIKKAARRINRELSLNGTTDEISIDATGEFISPDDDALRDLVILQVECLVNQREFNSELQNGTAGVMVNDGEQTVDTRQRASARSTQFNSDNSPCSQIKAAIKIEKL